MAYVSTYINTLGKTEEAFEFYRSIFGGEFKIVTRFRDMKTTPGGPTLSEKDLNGIMHIELAILGGHVLEGSDALASMGHQINPGNNLSISLHTDSKEEAERLYAALSVGSAHAPGMADMPWGAYWGSLEDRYGIRWMIDYFYDNAC